MLDQIIKERLTLGIRRLEMNGMSWCPNGLGRSRIALYGIISRIGLLRLKAKLTGQS